MSREGYITKCMQALAAYRSGEMPLREFDRVLTAIGNSPLDEDFKIAYRRVAFEKPVASEGDQLALELPDPLNKYERTADGVPIVRGDEHPPLNSDNLEKKLED